MVSIWRLRFLWVLIALLAAFVIFVRVIAHVGWSDAPIEHPGPRGTPSFMLPSEPQTSRDLRL